MRKVALNLQPLAGDHITGIGTYAREVVRRLSRDLQKGDYATIEGHVFDFLGRNKAEIMVRQHIETPKTKPFSVKTCKIMPLGLLIRMKKLGNIVPYHRLMKSDADITVFFNYLIPASLKGPSIITVYDMVCHRFPETMDQRNRKLLTKHLPESCAKADLIMTISEFSKREIVDCLGIPEQKIRVAYCGVNTKIYTPLCDEIEFTENEKRLARKWGVAEPFILYLGTLEPRKNVNTLITAFEKLKPDHPTLKLVLGGGLGWQYEPILEQIAKSPYSEDIIRTGYLSESDKIDLYHGATVFAFPSLYEGFGMPVLEAMACGTPVVTSNSSSLPEVVGDAGVLLDPEDADGFAKAMGRFIDHEEDIEHINEKMALQVEKFSWNATTLAYGHGIFDVIQ